MTKQAKIHEKTQSTKLDSYTVEKKKKWHDQESIFPHGFKIRSVETTEITPWEEKNTIKGV